MLCCCLFRKHVKADKGDFMHFKTYTQQVSARLMVWKSILIDILHLTLKNIHFKITNRNCFHVTCKQPTPAAAAVQTVCEEWNSSETQKGQKFSGGILMQLNALIYIMDIELRIILVQNPLEPFMLLAAVI